MNIFSLRTLVLASLMALTGQQVCAAAAELPAADARNIDDAFTAVWNSDVWKTAKKAFSSVANVAVDAGQRTWKAVTATSSTPTPRALPAPAAAAAADASGAHDGHDSSRATTAPMTPVDPTVAIAAVGPTPAAVAPAPAPATAPSSSSSITSLGTRLGNAARSTAQKLANTGRQVMDEGHNAIAGLTDAFTIITGGTPTPAVTPAAPAASSAPAAAASAAPATASTSTTPTPPAPVTRSAGAPTTSDSHRDDKHAAARRVTFALDHDVIDIPHDDVATTPAPAPAKSAAAKKSSAARKVAAQRIRTRASSRSRRTTTARRPAARSRRSTQARRATPARNRGRVVTRRATPARRSPARRSSPAQTSAAARRAAAVRAAAAHGKGAQPQAAVKTKTEAQTKEHIKKCDALLKDWVTNHREFLESEFDFTTQEGLEAFEKEAQDEDQKGFNTMVKLACDNPGIMCVTMLKALQFSDKRDAMVKKVIATAEYKALFAGAKKHAAQQLRKAESALNRSELQEIASICIDNYLCAFYCKQLEKSPRAMTFTFLQKYLTTINEETKNQVVVKARKAAKNVWSLAKTSGKIYAIYKLQSFFSWKWKLYAAGALATTEIANHGWNWMAGVAPSAANTVLGSFNNMMHKWFGDSEEAARPAARPAGALDMEFLV